MDNKIFIKVVFLGESEVGKTSLIDRYISGGFYDHPTSTANYSSKKINCDGKEYTFDIWDTSGYEKYRALTKYFIIDAHIIVLVYDISRKKTFLELDFWLDTVLKVLGPNISLILSISLFIKLRNITQLQSLFSPNLSFIILLYLSNIEFDLISFGNLL